MLPENVVDKIQANVNKPCFFKSLSPGETWKSKSMRVIPEEFVRSTPDPGAFENRVVCSVRWGNGWLLWVDREMDGPFIVEEDWNEFADDNFLTPNNILLFTHEDGMCLQVRILKSNGTEIMTVPRQEPEPEPEPVHPKPQNFHQATSTVSTSVSANVGNTSGRARQYVRKFVIQRYNLRFGGHNTPMTYILPRGKENGMTKIYNGCPCFHGWVALCGKYKLKIGDSVVCELELSAGVVRAVRVHFVNE